MNVYKAYTRWKRQADQPQKASWESSSGSRRLGFAPAPDPTVANPVGERRGRSLQKPLALVGAGGARYAGDARGAPVGHRLPEIDVAAAAAPFPWRIDLVEPGHGDEIRSQRQQHRGLGLAGMGDARLLLEDLRERLPCRYPVGRQRDRQVELDAELA